MDGNPEILVLFENLLFQNSLQHGKEKTFVMSFEDYTKCSLVSAYLCSRFLWVAVPKLFLNIPPLGHHHFPPIPNYGLSCKVKNLNSFKILCIVYILISGIIIDRLFLSKYTHNIIMRFVG